MKLTDTQAAAVASGRKSTHRVVLAEQRTWQRSRKVGGERRAYGPVQQTNPRPPYVGERIPISNDDGIVCYVEVTSVTDETLGDLTRVQAQSEGFGGARGPLRFKRAFLERHDRAWVAKREAEDDGLSDEQVAQRFADRHAGTDVVVLTWQLTEAPDEFLAPISGTTRDPKRSIDPEARVVDPDPAYVKRAAELAEQQRESFRRDLEAERARRKAERVPWLREQARLRRDEAA